MNETQRAAIRSSTLADFESWLKSQPPAEVVGDAFDGSCCPVATFVEQKIGISLFVADDEMYHGEGNEDESVETPPWARRVILSLHDHVDALVGAKHGRERPVTYPVTAAEVLCLC